jgi:hypothetical protein
VDQKDELANFLDNLKRLSRITFVLFNGTVVSGKFVTPKPHPDFIGRDPYEHRVLLKSGTVHSGNLSINHPKVGVEFKNIASWKPDESEVLPQ